MIYRYAAASESMPQTGKESVAVLKKHIPRECLHRAGRTFLQTACGVISAGLVAAVTEMVEQVPGWKTGLLVLFASAVSAGIAAVMNYACEESADSQDTDDQK